MLFLLFLQALAANFSRVASGLAEVVMDAPGLVVIWQISLAVVSWQCQGLVVIWQMSLTVVSWQCQGLVVI